MSETTSESRHSKRRGGQPPKSVTGERQQSVRSEAGGSKATSCGTSVRKRKLEAEAAERRAKVRRDALAERERIELQLIDEQLAADLAAGTESVVEPPTTVVDRRGRAAGSVRDWVANASEHSPQGRVGRAQDPRPEREENPNAAVEPVDKPPGPGAGPSAGADQLERMITDTLRTVRDAATGEGSRHLASRVAATRSLPSFSGDSLEWLKFKRAFDLSTQVMGFSDQENVARLFECLHGKAKDAVASLMLTASNAHKVMETLELRFGNPDDVLREIVGEIRKMSRIGSGHQDLATFATKVRNAVAAMEAVNHTGYLHSPELSQDIVDKMPSAMVYHFNHYFKDRVENEPRLVSLAKFLYAEAEMACKAGTSQSKPSSSRVGDSHRASKREKESGRSRTSAKFVGAGAEEKSSGRKKEDTRSNPWSWVPRNEKCGYCHESGHLVTRCKNFESRSVDDRWKWVKEKRACFLCLSESHLRSQCKGKKCDVSGCRRPHHRLLHSDAKRPEAKREEERGGRDPSRPRESSAKSVHNLRAEGTSLVLLKVLPILVSGPAGQLRIHALLDEGSTATLIDAEVAKQIGASGPRATLSLKGIGNTGVVDVASEKVSLKVRGWDEREEYVLDGVRTVVNLSLPRQTLVKKDVDDCTHLRGLTVGPYAAVEPTMLVGQDQWDLIVSRSIRSGSRDQPVASRTALGWVVHGNTGRGQRSDASVHLVREMEGERDARRDNYLHELVKTQFQIDSIGVAGVDRVNANDRRAVKILEASTKRVGDRWETGLLWGSEVVQLPDNKDCALGRLRLLEERLDKAPDVAELYYAEMDRLIENGHAEKIKDVHVGDRPVWYLPHFGVRSANKPGKVRLVFDAAAKSHGVCLNDKLLPGPDYLNSLLGVLFRFRQFQVAIKSDVKDMFLRVNIAPEDRSAQRFLWRGRDRDGEPGVYHMNSMVFGVKSSPCAALYVLNRNANEFGESLPHAVAAIKRKFYMDDYLDSMNSETEARRMIEQVTEINKSGGFAMHKWTSNRPTVLRDIPSEKHPPGDVDLNMKGVAQHYERTLGMRWNTAADTFEFQSEVEREVVRAANDNEKPTKRHVLSIVMSVFDPLGFLAPLTIRGRLLLQDIWRSGIAWDDKLECAEFVRWQGWVNDLSKVEQCVVPRCYLTPDKQLIKTELHTFCDASEQAYAAVTYWRFEYGDGAVDVRFVASKCRVAPVKSQSIPRLELQAALLASRLARTVESEHEYIVSGSTLWSDSRTVLGWIRSDPRTYQAFVSHRLREIDELTNANQWKWVPSEENPADEATREKPFGLHGEARWYRGPEFLRSPAESWPTQQHEGAMEQRCMALREQEYVTVTGPAEVMDLGLPDSERFSSWLRLLRSSAWVLLFADKCLHRGATEMTNELLVRAERRLVQKVQADCFAPELEAATRQESVPRGSRLVTLDPTLDRDGILRVRGRTSRVRGVALDTRYPVILDGDHRVTRLLIQHYHVKAGHANLETVVNELRQKWWVVHLRAAVRATVERCRVCRIRKAKVIAPRMSDLPECRLAHHKRPFTFCGLDYFGPLTVTIGRRREKRWVALFTCLTTRAVHLELVNTLNTDSAIMAVRRMAARRGQPSEIWSDNGTNFRGACNELRRAIEDWQEAEALTDYATTAGSKWRFIPPAAPHMGGSWERLVRCVKTALYATLKEQSPKEETLKTLLAEAEHTVNSRPLTHVSADPRDQEALTPNHFLIGASSGSAVTGRFNTSDLCSRKQWRVSQSLADQFWRRWVREYLPTLIPRKIWNEDTEPVREGDLVIVVDERMPRNSWPRGVVEKTFQGQDDRVRVAEVRTMQGRLVRPVIKLARLPIPED